MVDRLRPDVSAPSRPDALPTDASAKAGNKAPGEAPLAFTPAAPSGLTAASARAGEQEAAKVLGAFTKPSDLGGAQAFLLDRNPESGRYTKPASAKDFFNRVAEHADKPEVRNWLKSPDNEGLRNAVKNHTIRGAISELVGSENFPPSNQAQTGLSKQQLAMKIVNSYVNNPDLQAMTKKALPNFDQVFKSLDKLNGLS